MPWLTITSTSYHHDVAAAVVSPISNSKFELFNFEIAIFFKPVVVQEPIAPIPIAIFSQLLIEVPNAFLPSAILAVPETSAPEILCIILPVYALLK